MMKRSGISPLLLLCLCLLWGRVQAWIPHPALPPPLAAAFSAGPIGGNATFDQLIDHKNPGLGTFKQRYWWNTSHWNGPGSPVVLFTPGEVTAEPYTAYVTNRTMVGQYAQKIGGAMILFEHRYWGNSSPFEVLDTKNLTHLTLENSVQDLAYFAKKVKLPFDESGASNSPNAPWIMVGGSYSGALAAWIHKLAPGAFWAYHASSGPVHAVYNYWSYFLPIHRGMPKNCSADLQGIADHIDRLIERNNRTEMRQLKDMFGLADVEHDDDFAAGVGSVVNSWQSTSPTTNYSGFFKMCDSVEGVRPVEIYGSNVTNSTIPPFRNTTTVPATGVGLEKALPNFALWFKNEYLPDTCSSYHYRDWNDTFNTLCFDSYNTSSVAFHDYAVNNTINRQWFWMLCNEPFAYWQVSSPKDQPTFIPRHVGPEYYQRQCDLFFPPQGDATHGSAKGKTTDMLNSITEGWDLANTTRLIWINGEYDPWRSASVSSELRPGGPMKSTPEVPVYLLKDAVHCDDLTVRSGDANAGIKKAQTEMIQIMQKWVSEFYEGRQGSKARAWIG